MTVNDILGMMKRGEEIPVSSICEAVRGSDVKREHLEARIIEGGYFYVIELDSFIPPQLVTAMMWRAEEARKALDPNSARATESRAARGLL